MTGKDILEAMSFLEEAYVEEAEMGKLKKPKVIRVLLPLAACLCVAFFLFGRSAWSEVEKQAQAAIQETGDWVVLEKSENIQYSQNDIAIEDDGSIAVIEVPSVILRIEKWTDTGFTAVIERCVDTDSIPIGETVQVEFMLNICIEEYRNNMVYATRRLPTEADFPAGTLVLIRVQAINRESGVLRAEAISTVH